MSPDVAPISKPAVDGLRFHDQSRSWSAEVTRAFAEVIRAGSLGPQSEMSEPFDIALSDDMAIVRGVD